MDRYQLTYWKKDVKEQTRGYSDLDAFAHDGETWLRNEYEVIFSVPKYEPNAITKVECVFDRLGQRFHLHKDSDKAFSEYWEKLKKPALNGGLAGSAVGSAASLYHQGAPTVAYEYVKNWATNAPTALWNAVQGFFSSAGAAPAATAKTTTAVAVKGSVFIPEPSVVIGGAVVGAALYAYNEYTKVRLSVRATVSTIKLGGNEGWDLHVAPDPTAPWLPSFGW